MKFVILLSLFIVYLSTGTDAVHKLKPAVSLPYRPNKWPYYKPCENCRCMRWTKWMSADTPSATGDWETLRMPKNGYGTYLTNAAGQPGNINRLLALRRITCNHPIEIECRDKKLKLPFDDLFNGSPNDRTTANPKKVKCTTNQGLVCINQDQLDGECHDYEVRLLCWQPCATLRWSRWTDHDNPSGTGDYEGHQLADHSVRNYEPCPNGASPYEIHCRRKSDRKNAILTGESKLMCDRNWGFSCVKSDQSDNTCDDYEVRYLCRY